MTFRFLKIILFPLFGLTERFTSALCPSYQVAGTVIRHGFVYR